MALTVLQELALVCAEKGGDKLPICQRIFTEADEERQARTEEVIMNEKQQIEAVKQMAKRAAGVPTAPSEEFGGIVVKSVLEDIDEHVREELDIPAESYKTLDDDDTERDVMKAVAARVRALVELNVGFKRPDKEPVDDEEAVAKRTKKMAGIL